MNRSGLEERYERVLERSVRPNGTAVESRPWAKKVVTSDRVDFGVSEIHASQGTPPAAEEVVEREK